MTVTKEQLEMRLSMVSDDPYESEIVILAIAALPLASLPRDRLGGFARSFRASAAAETSARLVGAKMTPTIADEVACRVHAIMLDHVHRAEIINLDW